MTNAIWICLRRFRLFTLVELLVVIAIIMVLLSLVMPAFGMMRSQARKIVCGSNLRQNGIALHSYAIDCNEYFPSPGQLTGADPMFFKFSYYNILPEPSNRQGPAVAFLGYLANYNVLFCPAKEYSHFLSLFKSNYTVNYHALWMTYGYGARPAQSWQSTGYLRIKSGPLFTDNMRQMTSSNIMMTDLVGAQKGTLVWNCNQFDHSGTNHCSANGMPMGSNDLYSDGHVSGVNFKNLTLRLTDYSQGLDFWW